MPEFYKNLTPKEQEIYNLIINNIEGEKIEELAKKANISYYTMRTHLQHIYEKTGISSQIELIVKHYRRLYDDNISKRVSGNN